MRSERKMLPIGVENFEKLRRNDMYYVDKTEIIADLLRNHGDANLFTRPRRFGKTLTMDTLKTFFEIGQDASLFDGLAISRHSDICAKHQNKYPVVFLSLKDAVGMNYPDALKSIRTIVAREARRLSYLDIVIKIPDDEIGMIIEVKYGEDADMDKGCADALAQIERMNYSAILEDDEVQTIYKYGVACYKKRCKIVKA